MKMKKSAKICNSIDQVRQAINQIDEDIIDLLALRSQYVLQAAGFKKTENEVKAPARVKEVITRVRKLAQERGLSPQIAEALWNEMIKQFIALEINQL